MSDDEEQDLEYVDNDIDENENDGTFGIDSENASEQNQEMNGKNMHHLENINEIELAEMDTLKEQTSYKL